MNTHILKYVASGVAALVTTLFVAAAVLLHEADTGGLKGFLQRRIEATLRRPVRLGEIRLHLLARDPTVVIHGLVIANPGWLHRGNLAEVDGVVAHVALAPLLRGRFSARTIAATGLRLHLIRFAPGRNNWTLSSHPGKDPAFAPLAPTESLSIAPAEIDIRDYNRRFFINGTFRHDATGARPFALHAQGTLGGFPVALDTTGGRLNGPGVGPVWPFHAHLTDAATMVDAQGVAAQPFDLGCYDLGVRARGPNLADLGYLFGFTTPNSAPYDVRLRARADGRHFGFSDLAGTVGASDVTGAIESDHGTARRRVVGRFHTRVLTRADIDALLSQVPARARARAVSGAVRGVASGRWLLPDAPIGLARLRATDFDFTIAADRTAGYALPLRDVRTRVVAKAGLLRFPSFAAAVYGGRLDGGGTFDGRSAVPTLAVRLRLSDARLAAIGLAQPPSARLDLAADLTGAGASVHDAAGKARGTASFRLTGAVVPRRAGWALGGDLLRALGGGTEATLPISCAAAAFHADGDGLLSATTLGLQTPAGLTRGSGALDLGRERLAFTLEGHAAHKRALQFATPIRVEGPLLHPRVTILPGAGAQTLGLKGALGLALTPLAGLLPAKHATIPQAPLGDCA